MTRSCLLLLLGVCLITDSFATTYFVTNTNDAGSGSLRNILMIANADPASPHVISMNAVSGTILLQSVLPTITRDMQIIGSTSVNIDGAGLYRIFEIAQNVAVEMNSINLINGFTPGNGAGIYNLGVLTLNGGSFVNLKSEGNGGAVYSKGDLSISNCSFDRDSAAGNFSNGGAIAIQGATVSIIASHFANCQAKASGGAVSVNNCTVLLDEGHFLGNEAVEGIGGAVYGMQSALTVQNSVFRENISFDAGGGIAMYSGSFLEVSRSDFIQNFCTYEGSWGGGLYSRIKSRVSETNFEHNKADAGGGIYVESNTELHTCKFDGDTATSNGGAAGLYGDTKVFYCNFINNYANKKAGAIIVGSGDQVEIYNTGFSANTSLGEAGALLLSGSGMITNSTFSGNNASERCGAIYATSSSGLTLLNATIVENSAGNEIGGLGVFGSSDISNTILALNTATSSPDGRGSFASTGGHNLVQQPSNLSFSGNTTGNIYNQNPLIYPLNNNGGGTETHLLDANSPAVDAANNAIAPPEDQRDVQRCFIADIGATESGFLFSLGPDTTICSGDTINIGIASTTFRGDFLWNTGSTASTIPVTMPGTYYLQVTTACGTATDTIVLRNCLLTGYEEYLNVAVRVYPNPTSQYLMLELPEIVNKGQLAVYIYSADGKIVYNKAIIDNIETLDLNGLPSGAYWLRLLDSKASVFTTFFFKE